MTNVYEKTINTCEIMTIEIDEWGKNPRLFSFTHYHISLLKSSQERKQIWNKKC